MAKVRSRGKSSSRDKGEHKIILLTKQPRPPILTGHTVRIAVGCGHLYLTINYHPDDTPFEIFAHLGKGGGCACSQLEALCRSISLGLRYGIPAEPYVKQLTSIKCPSPTNEADSCADAIAKALQGEHDDKSR